MIQDDEREKHMIKLFGLVKKTELGRSGIDAFLILGNKEIPFELKSSSSNSITTGRDVGEAHFQKWSKVHWLIGLSKKNYYLYASPKDMSEWINNKKQYVKTDYDILKFIKNKLSLNELYSILGKKDKYDLNDAVKIQKKQLTIKEYNEKMDLKNMYSANAMLRILNDRVEYLIKRGSTLNNPHIPKSYFDKFKKIDKNHAYELRKMVKQNL